MRIEFDIPITSFISKFRFTWEWTITAIPICNTGSGFTANTLTRTTEQHLYVILEEPQAPMNPPWAGVLEYACAWAEGESDIDNATSIITSHLYTSGFCYREESSYFGNTNEIFNISQFLMDMSNSEFQPVNCVDMARAVVTFSNGIGNNLVVAKYTHSIENKAVFPVNHIDPIGNPNINNSAPTPTNNPFFTSSENPIDNDCRIRGFSFHAFALQRKAIISESKVWDATLRYDTDTDPDNVGHVSPPGQIDCGNTIDCGGTQTGEYWELPCKVDYETYINNLVDKWTRTPILPPPSNYYNEFCCSEPNNPCGTISFPSNFTLE